jgi:hypothetical protein
MMILIDSVHRRPDKYFEEKWAFGGIIETF